MKAAALTQIDKYQFTYQRDGHVLVGQFIFPPRIIDQIQDPAIPLHLAVHRHSRGEELNL